MTVRQTDRQMAFQLYIVDNMVCASCYQIIVDKLIHCSCVYNDKVDNTYNYYSTNQTCECGGVYAVYFILSYVFHTLMEY